jgi:hypothetical protein
LLRKDGLCERSSRARLRQRLDRLRPAWIGHATARLVGRRADRSNRDSPPVLKLTHRLHKLLARGRIGKIDRSVRRGAERLGNRRGVGTRRIVVRRRSPAVDDTADRVDAAVAVTRQQRIGSFRAVLHGRELAEAAVRPLKAGLVLRELRGFEIERIVVAQPARERRIDRRLVRHDAGLIAAHQCPHGGKFGC